MRSHISAEDSVSHPFLFLLALPYSSSSLSYALSLSYLSFASEDVMKIHDEILGKKPCFLFTSNTESPINESHYIDDRKTFL